MGKQGLWFLSMSRTTKKHHEKILQFVAGINSFIDIPIPWLAVSCFFLFAFFSDVIGDKYGVQHFFRSYFDGFVMDEFI
jgi:hypothetical protein